MFDHFYPLDDNLPYYLLLERNTDKFYGIFFIRKQIKKDPRNRVESVAFVPFIQKNPLTPPEILADLISDHFNGVVTSIVDLMQLRKIVVKKKTLENKFEYRETLWKIFWEQELTMAQRSQIEDWLDENKIPKTESHEKIPRQIAALYWLFGNSQYNSIVIAWEKALAAWQVS